MEQTHTWDLGDHAQVIGTDDIVEIVTGFGGDRIEYTYVYVKGRSGTQKVVNALHPKTREIRQYTVADLQPVA